MEQLAPNTYVLSLPIAVGFEKERDAYQRLEHFEYVEPNLPVEVESDDDPEYFAENIWGMESRFGSNGFTGSTNVYVAVTDSGINYNHPDRATNVWTDSGEALRNGVDDDGNGFIDDVHGYDLLNEDGFDVASINHNIKLISQLDSQLNPRLFG